MPLFECSKCHVVENTALSNWATRNYDDLPALCSECDPEIGQWHARFDKEHVKVFRAKFPKAQILGDPGYLD